MRVFYFSRARTLQDRWKDERVLAVTNDETTLDLALVQAICDAPVREGGWDPVLRSLPKLVDAQKAHLVLRTPRGADIGEQRGFLHELWGDWSEHWQHDPGGEEAFRAAPLGQIVNFDAHLIMALDSRFIRAAHEGFPDAVGWGMSVALWRNRLSGGFLTIFRGLERPQFEAAEERHLSLYVPLLMSALEVHRRLEWLRLEREAARDILDALPVGVVLTSDSQRVLDANRVAKELLDERDGVQIVGDRIVATDTASQQAYRGLLDRNARTGLGEIGHAAAGGSLSVARRGRRSLSATVAPIGRDSASLWHADRPAAVTFIADPERKTEIPLTRLERTFGLSRAEAQLAQALAAGDTLQQAGERLGRRPHTVRKQLQFVYAKTNTHRQSELVQLLTHSAAIYDVGDEE
jgi:DNA-binding CsgD family transcriptional regulator/PAS domain-containing protein